VQFLSFLYCPVVTVVTEAIPNVSEQRQSKKNAVFLDVTPCGTYEYQRFGRTYRLHHQGGKNHRARNVTCNLLITANVPIFLILVTLMIEMIHSSETLVLTRATLSHIPEDGILYSHLRGSLKSYKASISNPITYAERTPIPD
jgi:hypothetical protein